MVSLVPFVCNNRIRMQDRLRVWKAVPISTTTNKKPLGAFNRRTAFSFYRSF
jgi:hypothetical protein